MENAGGLLRLLEEQLADLERRMSSHAGGTGRDCGKRQVGTPASGGNAGAGAVRQS